MIYALLGALVIGLSLGIFGSGGSILTVPVLLYLLHHEDKVAIAESLGIVGAIALVTVLPYARDRLVQWRTAALFGAPGMAGTAAGAWGAAFVPGVVQLLVFAAVMVAAAVFMWRRSRSTAEAEPVVSRPLPLRLVRDGVAVGALTGFVGVGGGFLIVPALVLLGGLPMRRAVATSLCVISMTAMVGFATHLRELDAMGMGVDWLTIAVIAGVGILGSFAGRAVGGRIKAQGLQRGFAAFLLVMALFIVVRESAGLAAAPTASEPAATSSTEGE